MERNPFTPAKLPQRTGADRWIGAGTAIATFGTWAIVLALLAFGGGL